MEAGEGGELGAVAAPGIGEIDELIALVVSVSSAGDRRDVPDIHDALEDDSVGGIVIIFEIDAAEREMGLGESAAVVVCVGIRSSGRDHSGSAADNYIKFSKCREELTAVMAVSSTYYYLQELFIILHFSLHIFLKTLRRNKNSAI